MTYATGSCELYGLTARASTFPIGFCTKSGTIPSPQGVLRSRTDGKCSSERRIARILHLGLGKVNRNVKSPDGRGFFGLAIWMGLRAAAPIFSAVAGSRAAASFKWIITATRR